MRVSEGLGVISSVAMGVAVSSCGAVGAELVLSGVEAVLVGVGVETWRADREDKAANDFVVEPFMPIEAGGSATLLPAAWASAALGTNALIKIAAVNKTRTESSIRDWCAIIFPPCDAIKLFALRLL